MENEIVELLKSYEKDEISYKDLYIKLQNYPSELRDKVMALYILGGYND
jgi:hypothetical protein